jgi:hypothetical protein
MKVDKIYINRNLYLETYTFLFKKELDFEGDIYYFGNGDNIMRVDEDDLGLMEFEIRYGATRDLKLQIDNVRDVLHKRLSRIDKMEEKLKNE